MKINYNEEDLMDHKAPGAVIKDKQGNILMQEHVKYGFWTTPIGKAKHDQNIEEALKEEIFEECNLTVEEYCFMEDFLKEGRCFIIL